MSDKLKVGDFVKNTFMEDSNDVPYGIVVHTLYGDDDDPYEVGVVWMGNIFNLSSDVLMATVFPHRSSIARVSYAELEENFLSRGKMVEELFAKLINLGQKVGLDE